MILTLRVGMRVLLPSGNVVVLMSCARGAWVCEFSPGCNARGQVEFSGAWLRKWGRRV